MISLLEGGSARRSLHASGTVERRFRRVCKRTPVDDLKGAFDEIFGTLPFTLLEARARVDGTNVIFDALSVDFGSILGSGESPSYSFIAGTSLGKETPESRDKNRKGEDVVRLLAGEQERLR